MSHRRLQAALVLALLFAGADVSAEAPRTRRPTTSAQDVQRRSRQIGNVLRGLRRPGVSATSAARAERYLQGESYQRDIGAMVEALGSLDGHASPQVAYRAAGAVARTILDVERATPGVHAPELVDRAHRLLAQARVGARLHTQETAVELELTTNALIIDALTTVDGTVESVLREGGRPVPDWLTRRAQGGDPRRIQWDSLSRDEKKRLIISQGRTTFHTNRTIPGLRFRTRLAHHAGTHPRGLGHVRVEGRELVVEDALLRRVEYESIDSLNTLDGVEAHVRQNGRASGNLHDAAAIRDALGSEHAATHQHITANIDPGIRSRDALQRIGLVDFYRRANLVAELRLMGRGGVIRAVGRSFDFLRGSNLGRMNEFLDWVGRVDSLPEGRRGQAPMIESALKLSAVGFRTGALYNNDAIYGFEARTLEGDADADREGEFVDALQRGLVGGHYGLPRDQYARWRQRLQAQLRRAPSVDDEGEALSSLHYNRNAQDMLDHLPPHLRLDDDTATRLLYAIDQDYSAKMLIHDWSNDPVFLDDPAGLELLNAAQAHALERIAADRRTPIRNVVRDFARHAGLLERFERSIGM